MSWAHLKHSVHMLCNVLREDAAPPVSPEVQHLQHIFNTFEFFTKGKASTISGVASQFRT